jgi:hypothetical protein
MSQVFYLAHSKDEVIVMLSTEDLVLLNKYAQCVVSRNLLCDWFKSLDILQKKQAIRGVWNLAIQANLSVADVENATKIAKLKKTHTPVAMLLSEKVIFKNRGYGLSNLEGTVLYQAFSLVLECFSIAEQRRKKLCEDNSHCNHWWHKDLSNADVLKELKIKF